MSSMNGALWERFANYDNFLLAWQRTVNASNRMLQDELGMKVFAYNLQANLEEMVRQVRAEDFPYCPLADHKVYVPKPSKTLRTMSLLSIPDLIVYQALANVVADLSHPSLVTHENQHVWGNLYAGPNKRWMLQPWLTQYKRFTEQIEQLYRAGNAWVASTDIVSYYDTIDHERLLKLVREHCGEDRRFEEQIKTCLATWSAHPASAAMGRGIPQGSNASDYLANLYLYATDRAMIVSGYHYNRYVDDVRILGPDESTVQRGLILFDMELKRVGLVAQVTKTTIHRIEDIETELQRLRFRITDPTGAGAYVLVALPSQRKGEQAASVSMEAASLPWIHVGQSDDTDKADEDQDEENADLGPERTSLPPSPARLRVRPGTPEFEDGPPALSQLTPFEPEEDSDAESIYPESESDWPEPPGPEADLQGAFLAEAILADMDDEEISPHFEPLAEEQQALLLQDELRAKLSEVISLLDDPDRGKEAETTIVYCLNRLDPHDSLREIALGLLDRLPWRSEAVTRYLASFEGDAIVGHQLEKFAEEHRLYPWHAANALWALSYVAGAKQAVPLCRRWLVDAEQTWYARMVAARILADVPGQHAFLVECLRREQDSIDHDSGATGTLQLQRDGKDNNQAETTAILRQELAFGAFQGTKARQKQLTLLQLICQDPSPVVKCLAIYLLQQPTCKIAWQDLGAHRSQLSGFSELIRAVGLSSDAPRPCFIAQTISTMYAVALPECDLRSLYKSHYERATQLLRESVGEYHREPSRYVRAFHQFSHLSLIAFYQSVLPSEGGLFESEYNQLCSRGSLAATLPRGVDTWKRLGPMRNRVDHPVDRRTRSHAQRISVKEAEDLHKELQVALQELFDVWCTSTLASSSPPPVGSVPA